MVDLISHGRAGLTIKLGPSLGHPRVPRSGSTEAHARDKRA
jgi:hypothetical protein